MLCSFTITIPSLHHILGRKGLIYLLHQPQNAPSLNKLSVVQLNQISGLGFPAEATTYMAKLRRGKIKMRWGQGEMAFEKKKNRKCCYVRKMNVLVLLPAPSRVSISLRTLFVSRFKISKTSLTCLFTSSSTSLLQGLSPVTR